MVLFNPIFIFAFFSFPTYLSQFELWTEVYSHPAKNKLNYTDRSLEENKAYKIVHNKIKSSDSLFYHFIWLERFIPSIAMAKTDENCTLSVDWDLYTSKSSKNSIYLIYQSNKCKIKDGLEILSFSKIKEMREDRSMAKEYSLSGSSYDSKIDVNSHISSSIRYKFEEGNIFISFSVKSKNYIQDYLPYLKIESLFNLISIQLSNLSTASCESNFAVEFSSAVSGKLKLNSDNKRSFNDIFSPTVFESFQISANDFNSSNSVFSSFYWKNVAFSESSRVQSSTLFSLLSHFSNCSTSTSTSDTLELFGEELSDIKCGEVLFESINRENCFHTKSFMIWEAMVGFKAPPKESVSILILVLVSIGYAVPFMTLVGVLVFMFIRNRKYSYQVLDILSEDSSVSDQILA